MAEWPAQLNAYRFFLGDRVAEGRADRTALRLDDRTLSFGDVDDRTAGFAASLESHGVTRGDRVLIVVPDGLEFVAALFASLRIGAVAVMINPGLVSSSIGEIVDRSRATVAVVSDVHRDHFDASLAGWSPRVVDPASFDPGASEIEAAGTAPSDPALWLFSGGTTGVPKAVVQTHRGLVNAARRYGQGSLGLTPDDVAISVPKLYFGYAMGSNLMFPFSVGASAVLFEGPPTPEALFERIERHRATILVNVPSAVNQMVSSPLADEADLSSLRLATSAGEPLPESLYHRWKEMFGVELLDGLGTAEMWHVFVTNTPGDVKPGTLGKVVPGYELKVCDDEGNEVEVGEVGRMWVRGESLGLGYFEDPDQTAEAFRGDWYASGDLVSVDADGYVTHRGRVGDAMKVKGKWFRPQEVESILLEHDAVAACAVISVDDEAGLAKPVAFVVATSDVDEDELIEWVVRRTEPYKRPRQVLLVDELPVTHLGKVDRGALRRLI